MKLKNYIIYIKESKRGFYTYARVGKITLAEFVPNKKSGWLVSSIEKANRSLNLIKGMGFKTGKEWDDFMKNFDAKKLPKKGRDKKFPIKMIKHE